MGELRRGEERMVDSEAAGGPNEAPKKAWVTPSVTVEQVSKATMASPTGNGSDGPFCHS